MFSRFRALYLRYRSHHAARFRGVGLPRHGLRRLGQLEQVAARPDGVRLVGWAVVSVLQVEWTGGAVEVRPDLPRPDAARGWRRSQAQGFEVTLPAEARGLRLSLVRPSGCRATVPLSHPADPPDRAARRRMMRAFLRDLMRALPSIAAFCLTRDPAAKAMHRRAVKRVLGLDTLRVPVLGAEWAETPVERGADAPDPGPYTVILPIHDAFDVTCAALLRLARYSGGDWHVIVIDDASRDGRMRPFLRNWVADRPARATLVELDRNEGFVRAANRGLALARGRPGPVVLLNSDALVPDGWAERLLAPLAEPSVASVTPLSNDGEIFGAPLPGVSVDLPPGLAEGLDRVARGLPPPVTPPDMPTGVGFCMAMSRRWLDRVPGLDPAFGRGYGEEVDWSRRVAALGGRHVAQPRLFVEHRGGGSFGVEKAARVEKANAEIRRRYPTYDADVQGILTNDPLRGPRMTLAVAAAGEIAAAPGDVAACDIADADDTDASGGLPLYLGHALGGGAEAALRREVAGSLGTCGAALVLRVGGPHRWRLEVHLPQGVLMADTDRIETIANLLRPVPRLRIIYSCGVGDHDPVGLPDHLLGLRRAGHGDSVAARLHDFFPLSPSYCLLDSDGRFRGPVAPGTGDAAHRAARPDGAEVPLSAWRAAWGRFLAQTTEITVFSRSSGTLLTQAYPDLADRVRLRPHSVPDLPGPVARGTSPVGHGVIGVLGNLNRQKGAAVVAALGRQLRRRGAPHRVVVIGHVDASCPMPSGVTLHGGYERGEISGIAARLGVGAWVVPSVWPETFSFTTHEALATDLPVHAFDIGGQGEAVRAAPNGHAVPFDPDGDLAASMARSVLGAGGVTDEVTDARRGHGPSVPLPERSAGHA